MGWQIGIRRRDRRDSRCVLRDADRSRGSRAVAGDCWIVVVDRCDRDVECPVARCASSVVDTEQKRFREVFCAVMVVCHQPTVDVRLSKRAAVTQRDTVQTQCAMGRR